MITTRRIGGRSAALWLSRKEAGSGRPWLVFVHGSGGDHTHWQKQYSTLGDLCPIAAVDLPGHGRSEGPGEQEVSAYAGWLKLLLDEAGISRPVLVGHSLGAAICLAYAAAYGGCLSAVVAVGGGLTMPVNPLILEGLKKDPAAVIALAAKVAVARENRERVGAFIAEGLSRVAPAIISGDFAACSRFDITGQAAAIRVPTLIVCGAQDKMTPPSWSQALKEKIASASLVLVEGAGHYVMLEEPEGFNRALASFIEALPEAG